MSTQASLFGGAVALIGDAMAKRKKAEIATTPGFDRFWAEWPAHFRKVDRKGCFAKWHSRGLECIVEKIIAAVKLWKACDQWRKDSGQFIPAPIVWLNQERWDVTIDSFPELRKRRGGDGDKWKFGTGPEIYDA